jgi:Na+/H+ antiporter NhaD/arsenite permease-like protein
LILPLLLAIQVTEPFPATLGLAIILVVVVIIGVWFMRRRKPVSQEEKKRSRISDRWIPAGVLAGVGLGMLVFGFTYNPFAIPGLTLLGLGIGFALSIILRKEEREN